MSHPAWDVVVCGAGPAGSAAAALLASRGWRVALLDRSTFPRPKACAEYLSPGVASALARLGVWDTFQAANPRAVPGMDIVAPSGRTLRMGFGSHRSALAWTLTRRDLDALLVSQAVARGARFFPSHVVKRPVWSGRQVTGVIAGHSGEDLEFRARITVVADGGRSTLTRALGLARRPLWPNRLGLVAHYSGCVQLDDGFGRMIVSTEGYCGIAPLPENGINVAMVLPAHSLNTFGMPATAMFEAWINRHRLAATTLRGCERVDSVRGLVPVGARTQSCWLPGALIVGDAAGFFDPFTGEGLFRALRGAELAAAAADQALASSREPTDFSHYARDRRREFTRKQLVTAIVQCFVQYPRLLEYAAPRLADRDRERTKLARVLGDVAEAGEFLRLPVLWAALQP